MDGTLRRASYVFLKSCIYCGGWRKGAKTDSYTYTVHSAHRWWGGWDGGSEAECWSFAAHTTLARTTTAEKHVREGGREGEEGNDFSPNPSGVEASERGMGPTRRPLSLTQFCFPSFPIPNRRWTWIVKSKAATHFGTENLFTSSASLHWVWNGLWYTVQDKMDKGITKLPMDSDCGVF